MTSDFITFFAHQGHHCLRCEEKHPDAPLKDAEVVFGYKDSDPSVRESYCLPCYHSRKVQAIVRAMNEPAYREMRKRHKLEDELKILKRREWGANGAAVYAKAYAEKAQQEYDERRFRYHVRTRGVPVQQKWRAVVELEAEADRLHWLRYEVEVELEELADCS